MRTVRTYSEALLHLTPLGNSPETVVIHKGGLTSFVHWDPAADKLEHEFSDGRRERVAMITYAGDEHQNRGPKCYFPTGGRPTILAETSHSQLMSAEMWGLHD